MVIKIIGYRYSIEKDCTYNSYNIWKSTITDDPIYPTLCKTIIDFAETKKLAKSILKNLNT